MVKKIVPCLVILLVFWVNMQYWAEVAQQCPNFCGRGYDDAPYYQDFVSLLNGSWPGNIVLFQSPLPALYLWLVQAIFRYSLDSLVIPYLIQIFLITLIGAFIYKITSHWFNRSAGIIALLLWGFYEFVRFYATTIEANIPITFALTAALYVLLLRLIYPGKRVALTLAAAIFLGIAVLGRTNNLVVIGAVIFWFVLTRTQTKKLLVDSLIIGLGPLLLILPATIHNFKVSGQFVLITSSGAYNFTMGNLPGAPGTYWDQATPDIKPALQFISQQPLAWLLLTLNKFRLFFTFPWSPAPAAELPFDYILIWVTLTGLTGYYFFKTFTRKRSLLHLTLIFYAASIIFTHVEDEYRIPVLPVIFIFVAVALANLLSYGRTISLKIYQTSRQRRILKPVIIFGWSLLVILIFEMFLPGNSIAQTIDSVESQAAYGGVIVGQKFQIACPNLYQIRVKMFSKRPGGTVDFHLKEGSAEGIELNNQTIATAEITTFDYYPITFNEIPDSAGKLYTFYFDTAGLKSPDEGIYFAGGRDPFAESLNRLDFTKRITGGAFVSLGELESNLAFLAFCKTSLPQRIVTAINRLAKLTGNPSLFQSLLIFWLVAHLIALVGSGGFILYKIFRKPENFLY